jgi:hypothetical protein
VSVRRVFEGLQQHQRPVQAHADAPSAETIQLQSAGLRETVHRPQFAEEARQELHAQLDQSHLDPLDRGERKLCVRFAGARASFPHGLINQEQEPL